MKFYLFKASLIRYRRKFDIKRKNLIKLLPLFLLLAPQNLQSNEDDNIIHNFRMSTTQGDPAGVVFNSASVISGEFFFHEQAILAEGADPLAYSHYYQSSFSENDDNGFIYTPYLKIMVYLKPNNKYSHNSEAILIPEPNGSQFVYVFKGKSGKDRYSFRFKEDNLNEHGVINHAYIHVSAQTNPTLGRSFLNTFDSPRAL